MLLRYRDKFRKKYGFRYAIGCARFAGYCGKMYSRHLFSYGGLQALQLELALVTHRQCKFDSITRYKISNLALDRKKL